MERYFKNILIVALILLSNATFSQEKEISRKILDSSCECISKISVSLDDLEKNTEIKSCINTASIQGQIKGISSQLGIEADGKVNLDSVAKNDIIIETDKDYEIIREKLLNDCPAVRALLNANESLFENSVSDKKSALKFYTNGQDFDKKEQYDKAIAEYKKAVKKDPKFAFAWDNMGLCYRKTGNFQAAIDCYKKSLALDPKGTVPLMNMGVAYGFLKDYVNAAAAYKQYIEYYPGDPEGYYGAGRMLFFAGDAENGLDNLFQAYLLYKQMDSPYVHDAENNISVIYKDMKDKNQLDIFKKVAKKYNINITE